MSCISFFVSHASKHVETVALLFCPRRPVLHWTTASLSLASVPVCHVCGSSGRHLFWSWPSLLHGAEGKLLTSEVMDGAVQGPFYSPSFSLLQSSDTLLLFSFHLISLIHIHHHLFAYFSFFFFFSFTG